MFIQLLDGFVPGIVLSTTNSSALIQTKWGKSPLSNRNTFTFRDPFSPSLPPTHYPHATLLPAPTHPPQTLPQATPPLLSAQTLPPTDYLFQCLLPDITHTLDGCNLSN